MVTAGFQESKYESELAKQPSEHDIQPWIQPRPEIIIDQIFFLAEIFHFREVKYF